MIDNNLIFKPLFESESSTWTYLLVDKMSKEAVIIDAVAETFKRDTAVIDEMGLNLKYIIETHIHADHITSSCPLKGKYPNAQIVLGEGNNIECADIFLADDESLKFGEFKITAILTPGHTSGCTSYAIENMVFTGDALLIRSCGRCDFQGGSAKTLYHSLQKLLKLDDNTLVFPGHDYSGRIVSTIGEEKEYNEMIGGNPSEAEFIHKVDGMQLSLPKKIHIAVPSNQVCGMKIIQDDSLLGG
jgi:sulfur dioxygenase